MGLADDAEGVWVLFAAVCSHKFVMSFCIGVELGRMIHLLGLIFDGLVQSAY